MRKPIPRKASNIILLKFPVRLNLLFRFFQWRPGIYYRIRIPFLRLILRIPHNLALIYISDSIAHWISSYNQIKFILFHKYLLFTMSILVPMIHQFITPPSNHFSHMYRLCFAFKKQLKKSVSTQTHWPWNLTWISPVVFLIVTVSKAAISSKERIMSDFNLSSHNISKEVPFMESMLNK